MEKIVTNNKLAKKFGFWSLALFALPTMAMMLITGLYSIVDAVFISRLVSTNALSSVNIVFPVQNVVFGVGVMLATGGSAIIARKLGQKKEEEARRNFSFLVLIGLASALILSAIGLIFLDPIVRALGASDLLFQDAQAYLRTLLFFAPVAVLNMIFVTFFVTAGRPNLGMFLSIGAGVVNGVMDYVFIHFCGLGVVGAAIGTGIGQAIPVVVGTILFFRKKGTLYFGRPKGSLRFVGESCFNGSSEMVSNLSMGLTTFLFNIQMMRLLGEDGVAAVTIVMCVQFILTSLLLGYSMGVAPVISYDYGKGDTKLLRRIIRNSMIFISAVSVLMCAVAPVAAPFIIHVFTGDPVIFDLAMQGVVPYAISFLFCGINIFASNMYTAFSNGKVSALLSFLRTCVLLAAGILLLPIWLDVMGIWLAVPAAELLALIVSLIFLKRARKTYHY